MSAISKTRSTRRTIIAWQRMTRSYQQVARREREVLAPFHLTTAQFDVLSHLSRTPGLSQQALAERLLVTKGNICGLIDRLEIARLVERRAVPNDRRAYQLYLTEEGKKVFLEAAPALEQDLALIFSTLTEDELRSLSGLLSRLEQHTRTPIQHKEIQK